MAYKLRSQDLKDATAGTTSAAIKAGGEERKAQRAEMKEIRQGLRDVRKSMKSVDLNAALDAGDQASVDKYMGAQSRKEQLTKKKADIKDWSTRKRVAKGYRKDVNLLDKPIQAVDESGTPLNIKSGAGAGTAANISQIHADQRSGGGEYGPEGTGISDSRNYQNVYNIKGEYTHSIPVKHPGTPKGGGMPPFPDRPDITPPPKWKHSKEKGKLGAKPKKTRVVQNKLRQERVQKVAPLKTAVANLFGNPTVQFKQGRAKTRDRKNDLYSNTRSHQKMV